MTFLKLTLTTPAPCLVNTAHVAALAPAEPGTRITLSCGYTFVVLESLDAIAGWLAVAVVREGEMPDETEGDRNEQ